MKIISDFKDFYDGGMQYHDHSILYVRKSKSEYTKTLPFTDIPEHKRFAILCICGKAMPFFDGKKEMSGYNAKIKESYSIEKDCVFLSFEEIADNNFRYGGDIFRNDTKKFFDNFSYNKNRLLEFQVENKAPIIIFSDKNKIVQYENTNLFLNPQILQFNRYFNPFEVYQDIEMFISNNFTQQKEIAMLSDSSKIAKRGFNKYSFRKRRQE